MGVSFAGLACGSGKGASKFDAGGGGALDAANETGAADSAGDGAGPAETAIADVQADHAPPPDDGGAIPPDGGLAPKSCHVSGTPTPSPLCAGKSPCAIVADVELGCGPEVLVIGAPSVAPGTAGGGYAMIAAVAAKDGRPFLFTFDAIGNGTGDLLSLPCVAAARPGPTLVRATPTGEAQTFVQCVASGPLYSTEALRLVGGIWQAEQVGAGLLWDAGFVAGGRAYVLLGPDHDVLAPTTAALATRTAQGTWSVGPPVTARTVALAIDADGNAQVVTAQTGTAAGEVAFHALSSAGDKTLLQLAGNSTHLAAAATGKTGDAHDLVLASPLSPTNFDLHALLPSPAGYQDVALPVLSDAARTSCADGNYWALSVGGGPCATTTSCTLVGDINGSFGLATTADGTVWLAVVVRHVDEDVVHAPNGPTCSAIVMRDRSTQDLVVQRVVPGALWKLGTASRFPLGSSGILQLAVAAAQTRLYVTMSDGTTEPSAAKYVVLDTSLLP
jgi:hypothetical protein